MALLHMSIAAAALSCHVSLQVLGQHPWLIEEVTPHIVTLQKHGRPTASILNAKHIFSSLLGVRARKYKGRVPEWVEQDRLPIREATHHTCCLHTYGYWA